MPEKHSRTLRKHVGTLFPHARLFIALLVALFFYDVAVVYCDLTFNSKKLLDAGGTMTTSVIVGILLALRTNTAYDRWWEGRKLWGQLLNDSRNLILKLKSLVQIPDDMRELGRLIVAFPYALRNHLRSEEPDGRLITLGFGEPGANLPLMISTAIFEKIADLRRRDALTDGQLIILDPHVRGLMDVCGGCERILRSPIASAYKNMIWLGLGIYLLLLPWFLEPILGAFSIPVALFGAYFAIGLELLAEEVEQPFGKDTNDLALTKICNGIEQSVQLVLGPDMAPASMPSTQYVTFH